MCGIIGVFPLREKHEIQRQARDAACRYFATDLLHRSEERGRDAAGLGVVFPDGNWSVLKQPVAAASFTVNTGQSKYSEQSPVANYTAFMKSWRLCAEGMDRLPIVIGHARKSTGGNRYDPANNHPIITGGIIGVHNGTIQNADEIFKLHPERKRAGNVDSEGIFHLQHSLAQYEAPSLELMKEMDKRLYGTFTTLSINSEFPRTISGIRRGGYNRAVEICHLEELDLVLVASEKSFIEKSIESWNRWNISICGAKIPRVENVAWKNIPDKEAFLLHADAESLTDAVETTGLPMGENHKLKEYDFFKTGGKTTYSNGSDSWNTKSSHAHANSWNTTGTTMGPTKTNASLPSNQANINDTTDYQAHLSKTKEVRTLNPYSDESKNSNKSSDVLEVDVEFVGDDDTRESISSEEIDAEAASLEGMELLQSIIEDSLDTSLFLSRLNKRDVYEQLKVPAGSVAPEGLLLDAASSVYKEAFPEGYVRGYLVAKEKFSGVANNESLTKELTNLERRYRKTTTLVANLKTALMVALVRGGMIDVSANTLVVDSELFDAAKQLNHKFSGKRLMSIFSSKKDVEKIETLVAQEEFEDAAEQDEDTTQAV